MSNEDHVLRCTEAAMFKKLHSLTGECQRRYCARIKMKPEGYDGHRLYFLLSHQILLQETPIFPSLTRNQPPIPFVTEEPSRSPRICLARHLT